MMQKETIGDYLHKYGWQYETADTGEIFAGFGDEESQFLAVFQLSDPWLRISVPALMPIPKQQSREEFLIELLKLNYASHLARFALDDQDHVIMCLEMYAPGELDYAQFEVNLDAITHYTKSTSEQLWNKLSETGEEKK